MPAAAHSSSHSRADKIRGGLLTNAGSAIKGLIDNQALRFPQYSRFSSESEEFWLSTSLRRHVGCHALPRCLNAHGSSEGAQTGEPAVRFHSYQGAVQAKRINRPHAGPSWTRAVIFTAMCTRSGIGNPLRIGGGVVETSGNGGGWEGALKRSQRSKHNTN